MDKINIEKPTINIRIILIITFSILCGLGVIITAVYLYLGYFKSPYVLSQISSSYNYLATNFTTLANDSIETTSPSASPA